MEGLIVIKWLLYFVLGIIGSIINHYYPGRLIVIITSLILLVSSYFIYTYEPYKPEMTIVSVNVKFVDGSHRIIKAKIPKSAYLSIGENRGSYFLKYGTDECSNPNCFGVIRNGVIDFEIIK